MKIKKYTDPIHVLGVTFKNINEVIDYALEGVAKDGVYVGKDAELYPCFDSEDYASEDRFFWNIVFAKSLEELEDKKAELEDAFYNCNYEKFTEELAPMAYWGGDTYNDVKITDDME